MALRVRFQFQTGSSLYYSIERLADGMLYDFSTSTFVATPTTPTAVLPEDSGIFLGRYKVTLAPTPTAQFLDGDYAVTVHEGTNKAVVAELGATMKDGDDGTYFPAGVPPMPWSLNLPGPIVATVGPAASR